jgi:lipoprotein-anchoring transpeptidase ErfK/SrfK
MNDRTSLRRAATATQGVMHRRDLPWLDRQYLVVALLAIVFMAIPGSALAARQSESYVVQQGDTLAKIAARMGVSTWALAEANGIYDANLIYVGQVLATPGESADWTPQTDRLPIGYAWIDIDLSEQWLTAYEGDNPVFGASVSTGVERHYTPVGEFAIEYMLDWQTMWGDDYYLPDVPYVMYFADYLAIHGTYWHDNFGSPMSHGCVNLPISEAGWLYNWVSIGTPAVIHY